MRYKCMALLIVLLISAVSANVSANQFRISSQTRDKINTGVVRLNQKVGSRLKIARSRATGIPSFISIKKDTQPPTGQAMSFATDTIPLNNIAGKTTDPQVVADQFFQENGDIFGMTDPATEVQLKSVSKQDQLGMKHLRYQQYYKGIPVIAGEMIVHLNNQNGVTMVNGEYLPDISVDTTPSISQSDALKFLKAEALINHNMTDYKSTTPKLKIFNLGLLKDSLQETYVVWDVIISGSSQDGKLVSERYLADAHTGALVFHSSEIRNAFNGEIYNGRGFSGAIGALILSGTDTVSPVCSYSPPDPNWALCNDPIFTNAYTIIGNVYNYFFSEHSRDSFDDQGSTMLISVGNVLAGNCGNASWILKANQSLLFTGVAVSECTDNHQMELQAISLDILGHEFTHGVVERTAGLISFYQSGALDEAYGDIFGNAVENKTNSSANWLISDGNGKTLRDMADPLKLSLAEENRQPDKVSSPEYLCKDKRLANSEMKDTMHTNAGVPSKAAYLMAAGTSGEPGGKFNGRTFSGIGSFKMEKLHYYALTKFLTSGSDFQDHYNALLASCGFFESNSLHGFITSDCTIVQAALDAVEMRDTPSCSIPSRYCPSGIATVSWAENFEGIQNWTHYPVTLAEDRWLNPSEFSGRDEQYASSGTKSIRGKTAKVRGDYAIGMTNLETIPANAFLQFNQSYNFASKAGRNDGGIVEYTTGSGGAVYLDAGSMISMNGYTGNIFTNGDNPLAGNFGFANTSYGYQATRVDLQTLTGQDIKLRFRIGSDSTVGGEANEKWDIDDVTLYTCDMKREYEPGATGSQGGTGTDQGNAVATDEQGNVYIVGYFMGTANLDPTTGADNYTSIGGTDIFLTKVNADGTYGWTKAVGSAGTDNIYGVAVRGRAVYVTGYLSGPADFGGSAAPDITPTGGPDAFLAKYLSDGTFSWAKGFGVGGSVSSNAAAVDNTGNVFIAGFFSGASVDFDPGAGVDAHSSQGGNDIFFSRINADGTYGWTKTIGGTSFEQANGISVDGSGNVYIAGKFANTVDFDPGAGVANLTEWGDWNRNAFVGKYKPDGSYIKAAAFGRTTIPGNIGYSEAIGIATDLQGNVFVTGYFGSYPDGTFLDFLDPANRKKSKGDDDIFITKIDPTLTTGLWTRAMGGTLRDNGVRVFVDSWNNVYATGFFIGPADLDGDGNPEPDMQQRDIFLTMLDHSDGSFGWTHPSSGSGLPLRVMTMASNNNDEGLGLTVDYKGMAYVTGYFGGGGSYDIGWFDPEGSMNGYRTSNGGADAFLVKFRGKKVQSIAVTPTNPQIQSGFTQQFTAVAIYMDGSSGDITRNAVWASDNLSVATIDQAGFASGISGGAANITASFDGVTSASVPLSVAGVTNITVTPNPASVPEQQTIQFSAQATYSDGTTADVTQAAAWVRANAAIATIDTYGLATGVNAGVTAIRAVLGGVTSPAAILTVTFPNLLTSISVIPSGWPVIFPGNTMQYSSIGTYQDGTTADISVLVTWASGDSSVASIDASGLSTAISVGTSNITASMAGITSPPATLTVSKSITSILIASSGSSIIKGATMQFTATATYADTTTGDITSLAQWISNDTTVATIDSAGLSTGTGAGSATITASVSTVTSQPIVLSVTNDLLSVLVSPFNAKLLLGNTLQYNAAGTYEDGTTPDITGSVVWSSSNPFAAAIDINGLITALAAGRSLVNAASGPVISGFNMLTVYSGWYDDAGNPLKEPNLIQGTDSTALGTNPEESYSFGSEVIFSYAPLDPAKTYRAHLTYYDTLLSGNTTFLETESGAGVHGDITPDSFVKTYTFNLPKADYADGQIGLHFKPNNPQNTAVISEILVEEGDVNTTWYDDAGRAEDEPHLVLGTDNIVSGTLAEQSYSEGQEVIFLYSGFTPTREYTVTLTYYDPAQNGYTTYLETDTGTPIHTDITPNSTINRATFTLPQSEYSDGIVELHFKPNNPANKAVISEISIVPRDQDGDGIPDYRDNCTLTANPNQRDTDSDGYGNFCDGDLDGDGSVNSLDLGLFKNRFLSSDPDADFNGDGSVNSLDLGLFKNMFLKPPGPSGLVP